MVLPPSPCSLRAMTSMEIQPQTQRSRRWYHGRQENSCKINFKLNLQFDQCDLVPPPSPCSSPSMMLMKMQNQRSRWWRHGRLEEDLYIINFKLNLQFEQCDSVLPPSPRSSPAMTSMEMPPQTRTQCSAIQRDSDTVLKFFLSLKYLRVTLFSGTLTNFFFALPRRARQERLSVYVSSAQHQHWN